MALTFDFFRGGRSKNGGITRPQAAVRLQGATLIINRPARAGPTTSGVNGARNMKQV